MKRLTLLVLPLLAACGGSASESPWPVEPLDMEPGPVGEDKNEPAPPDTSELDNYSGEDGKGPDPIAPAPKAPAPKAPEPKAPAPKAPAPKAPEPEGAEPEEPPPAPL